MEIGDNILELRKQKNFSQEDLAEKVGVSRQTISKWELSETYPDIEQTKRLAQIFNISLDDLTNNDIKNVLITKISNTDKNVKLVIDFIKIILLLIIIIVIILVSVVCFKDYFNVNPVSAMQSIECTIDGKTYNYEIWQTNESPYHLDKIVTNDSNLDIDVKKYINFEQIFKDIKASVTSRGGRC